MGDDLQFPQTFAMTNKLKSNGLLGIKSVKKVDGSTHLLQGFHHTGRLPLLVEIRRAHFNRRPSRSIASSGKGYLTG
jgi:hypothetical protein